MKLSVNGRYVDLDFNTPVPIRLSNQFATDSIAQSAAKAIARRLNIKRMEVCSQGTTIVKRVSKKG